MTIWLEAMWKPKLTKKRGTLQNASIQHYSHVQCMIAR